MSKNIKGDYKAIKDSYGFRGRFWAKGDVAHNVSDKELGMQELKHFELITGDYKKKQPEKDRPKTFAELSEESINDPILDAFGVDMTAEIPINKNA